MYDCRLSILVKYDATLFTKMMQLCLRYEVTVRLAIRTYGRLVSYCTIRKIRTYGRKVS